MDEFQLEQYYRHEELSMTFYDEPYYGDCETNMLDEERENADEADDDECDDAIDCDSCQALMINGVFCHEYGCSNNGKVYQYGAWLDEINESLDYF